MRRWIPLLTLAAGCSDTIRLLPAGDAQGTAAYHDLRSESRSWGDVKVWSPGSYEGFVDIRFRVRNTSGQPIEFDAAGAAAEVGVKGVFRRVSPEKAAGSVSVAPGKAEEIPLRFPLPPGVDAEDVEEIEILWTVRGPDGALTRSSVFVPAWEDSRYYYAPMYSGRYGVWGDRYFWP